MKYIIAFGLNFAAGSLLMPWVIALKLHSDSGSLNQFETNRFMNTTMGNTVSERCGKDKA